MPSPKSPLSVVSLHSPAAMDELLEQQNAAAISEELAKAAPRAIELGLQLGLNEDEIDAIKKGEDKLLQVILAFLKRKDPKPTWSVIVEALRSIAVNLPSLAMTVEEDHRKKPRARTPPLSRFVAIAIYIDRLYSIHSFILGNPFLFWGRRKIICLLCSHLMTSSVL